MPEQIEKKLGELVEGVKNLNEKHEQFEKTTGTVNADAKAAVEEIKTQLEPIVIDLQDMKQKAAAQKESFELFQKDFIAMGNANGNGDQMKEIFKEYDNHLAAYFKKNIPIPEDDVLKISQDIVKHSIFGVGDDAVGQQVKDLVAGSNVDGGFFLTTDRSSAMSIRMFESSPIRAIANVQTTTSDVWEIILDDGEPDAGWVGEVTARPDTDTAQIGLIKIPIHELYAKPKATQKMIDDAGFDIVSWHQGKVTRKFSRLENTAFVTGDGASKPKGYLDYAAWAAAETYERNAVEQIQTATAATIEGDDLISLQGSLFEDYQAVAQWSMSRGTFFDDILTLKATDDTYLINPRLLTEGGQLVLMGKPVNLFADMPAVANNSLSIAYADWREFYTIVDRFGIRVLRDPYTAKPYVLFYTTKRVGGAVTNYEAGKLLKVKST